MNIPSFRDSRIVIRGSSIAGGGARLLGEHTTGAENANPTQTRDSQRLNGGPDLLKRHNAYIGVRRRTRCPVDQEIGSVGDSHESD
jgi:hypothetical protein